jgi:hypothetical protein
MIGTVSRMFTSYIHWSFTTSLLALLSSLTAMFFIFTFFWAVWIAGVGWYQPNCIYVGSENFETGGSYYMDAFAISWTTFSTVVRIWNKRCRDLPLVVVVVVVVIVSHDLTEGPVVFISRVTDWLVLPCQM